MKNLKNYKLIIFDMDGTLYDISDLVEDNFNIARDYLINYYDYTNSSATKLLLDNHVYPYVSSDAKSLTKLFISQGIDIKHFDNYRSYNYPYQKIDKEKAVNINDLKYFKDNFISVLVTNNTHKNVSDILNHLGINESIFDEIVCNENENKTSSKKPLFEYVINKYNIKPNEVLSIGDRYNVDGKPINELGGDAIILSKPKSLNKVIKDKQNLSNCDDYSIY